MVECNDSLPALWVTQKASHPPKEGLRYPTQFKTLMEQKIVPLVNQG